MTWREHSAISMKDVKASVVIVSDSLFSGENDITNDVSGPLSIDLLAEAGIDSINLDYYPDDISALQSKIESDIAENIDIIIFIGGTGISNRDITIEAIRSNYNKELPGFGEEFRRQSIVEVQGKGILSRAIAGIIGKTIIVALPGSPNAVRLGLEILFTFLGHGLQLLKKE